MICSVRSALLLVLTVATEIKAENTVMLVIGDNMDITCHFNLDGPDERWKMLFSSSNHSIAKCDVSRRMCEKKLIDYGQLQGNCSSTTTPPNSDSLKYQINLTCSLTESFAGNVCCWVNNEEPCYTFPLPTTNGINPEDEVENKNDGLVYFVFAIILVVGTVAALVAVWRCWKKFCNRTTAGDQNKAGGPPALPKKEDPPEQNDRSKAPVPTHTTTTPVSGDADVPVTKVTKDEGLQYSVHEEETSRVVKRRGPPSNRGTFIQELMKRYNLTDEQLNREVKNSDIPYLVVCFDDVEFYPIAMRLAIAEQADVKRLYNSEGTQVAMMKCLKIWKERNPFQATYRALLDITLSLGKGDTADIICHQLTQHRTLD